MRRRAMNGNDNVRGHVRRTRKAGTTYVVVGTTLLSSLLITQPAYANPGNVTQLTMWHAMGGVPGTTLNHVVQDFNNSQNKIHVTLVYQGSYDDEFNKWKETQGSSGGPNIMQVYDVGTRYMIDSNAIVPMQDFINQSHYNISEMEPMIRGYYSIQGKLYSMPFNSSQPVLYYNKNMFAAAHITTPPTTYEQVLADAIKLTKKSVSGTKVYGISIENNGWYFEQMLGTQGAYYANQENGRNGKRATTAAFDNAAAVTSLNWWKTLYDKGVELNLGTNGSLAINAFEAGKTAMILESSGSYGDLSKGAAGKFTVGISAYPKPAGATGGPIIGGGSLWIPKTQSIQDQQAAWKFVQFAASPAEQAYWSETTGYFPITKAAYDQPSMKKYLEENPERENAIKQLHRDKLTHATQGASIGVFTQSRQDIQNMISSILLGQESVQQGLANTQKTVTQEIQQYNLTVGN